MPEPPQQVILLQENSSSTLSHSWMAGHRHPSQEARSHCLYPQFSFSPSALFHLSIFLDS